MNIWITGFGVAALGGSWLLKRHGQALDRRKHSRVLHMIPADDRALWVQPQDRIIGERFRRFGRFYLYGWMVDPWRECSHPDVERIYGDEINTLGGKRNQCHNCGRYW